MFADVDARAAEVHARTEALLESLNLPDQVRWDPLVTGGRRVGVPSATAVHTSRTCTATLRPTQSIGVSLEIPGTARSCHRAESC